MEDFEVIHSKQEIFSAEIQKFAIEQEKIKEKSDKYVSQLLQEIDEMLKDKFIKEKEFTFVRKKMMKSLEESQNIIDKLIKEQAERQRQNTISKEAMIIQIQERDQEIKMLKLQIEHSNLISTNKEKEIKVEISNKENSHQTKEGFLSQDAITQIKQIESQCKSEKETKKNKCLQQEINSQQISEKEKGFQQMIKESNINGLNQEGLSDKASNDIFDWITQRAVHKIQNYSHKIEMQEREIEYLIKENDELKEEVQKIQNQNIDLNTYLIHLESQVDHQFLNDNNINHSRSVIFKQHISLTLKAMKELCDNRKIQMEYSI